MLPEEERVPPYVIGRGPDYAVVGGLVFQELTGPYLTAASDGGRRAMPRLLIAVDREGAAPDPVRPRLVVLTSVLPDAANLGFQDLRDLIVTSVNGVPLGSLDDLRRAAASPPAPTTWWSSFRARGRAGSCSTWPRRRPPANASEPLRRRIRSGLGRCPRDERAGLRPRRGCASPCRNAGRAGTSAGLREAHRRGVTRRLPARDQSGPPPRATRARTPDHRPAFRFARTLGGSRGTPPR